MKSTSIIYENDVSNLIPSFKNKGYRSTLLLFVNGKKVPTNQCKQAKPNQTLLSFLRDVLRLTGSKLGCAEGGCGACTVMISKNLNFSVTNPNIEHYAVNACLMPVCAADGCHITTVEGVGSVKYGMHPIQDRMVELHGSQCGFCTPGIIVAIYALFASGNNSIDHMEEHLDGNLCRCTGYRPIWDSVKTLCDDEINHNCNSSNNIGPCGTSCAACPEQDECQNIKNQTVVGCHKSSTKDKCTSMSQMDTSFKSQPNEMFPKELLSYKDEPLLITSNLSTWIKPTTFEQLISLKSEHSDAKIVVGNTEVGIETKFKHANYPIYISASSIPDLTNIDSLSDKLIIGACTPLSVIQKYCDQIVSDVPKIKSKVEFAILNMLRWFASTQIRNVASLSGNLVTASPISDMNPLLAAAEAKIEIVSINASTRYVPVKDFFQSYRKVDLQPYEVLKSIIVPKITEHEPWTYILPFKQARRREDDISIVTSGIKMKLSLSNDCFIIEDAVLAFGGMAPTTILALKTASFLRGKEWCEETFAQVRKILAKELKLPTNAPGGQPEYRCALAVSFLYKFYLAISIQLEKDIEDALQNDHLNMSKYPIIQKIDDNERSGSTSFLTSKKPSIHGTQKHPLPQITDGCEKLQFQIPKKMPIPKASTGGAGLAVSHASGKYHCTGEAIYVDDIPAPENMLHSALIMADRACGIILSVDKTKALDIEGVIGIYTHDDLIQIGGNNELGPIFHDEEVFATKNIRHYGMVIGIVVAESLETAQLASRSVVVNYDETYNQKPIITMEEAIAANSFYDSSRHTIINGDVESILTSTDSIVVEGTINVGGQEHFYLETHSSLVIPVEGNEGLQVFSSTQAVDKTQTFCASAAGLPMHRVVAKTKRMGGGFGGKETRTVFSAAAAAVAARITNRPVKITLDRNVDMSITGSRHSFLAKYRACLIRQKNNELPKLGALDIKLFNNGGASFDLSGPVMDRALFHVDGCYKWSAFRAEGIVCKTNQPPHTAFRGFGGPQGIAICEHVIDHLASEAKIPVESLRRSSMYKESDHTPFGSQIIPKTWNIPTAWDHLMVSANYMARKEVVKTFNEKHKYKKRGIAILPTKFGIAFTTKFMNQGGSLVHVYTDGTVLISHGGTEMGQGLHTKVCQIAAQAFGIPISKVHIDESASDKVANAQPTAASMSTDLYGMATLDACRQIIARLVPIREQLGPNASFANVAKAAYFNSVDLSAHGFFSLPGDRCGYDWNANPPENYDGPDNAFRGAAFNYFTQGIAISEVEIDVLSGDHRTIRSDVLVDVGSSINPAIDVGQIEGAFIQGMGWATTEEMIWGNEFNHPWVKPYGRLFTQGPGTYKIPGFNDTPEEFNVELMSGVSNPFAVHSSKAVGEPPFFLGASVFFALKDAIREARFTFLSNEDPFCLNLPATSERIRMLCGDDIVVESIVNDEDRAKEDDQLIKEKVLKFQPKGCF